MRYLELRTTPARKYKCRRKSLFLPIVLVSYSVLWSPPGALSQENLVVPDQGTTMLLGTGYDSVTGAVKDRCVVGTSKTETIGGDGGTALLSHEEISNRRDFRTVLKLGASASFNIEGFSGSGKTDVMTQEEFNSHTYMLLARVQIANQSEVLSEYKLLQAAKELLASDKAAFLRVCGDSFIAARVTGGEFAALIRLQTERESEFQELRASFKGSYLSMGGGSSAVSSSVQETFERYRGSIRIIRRGGISELPQFWSPGDVREYTRRFPTEVSGSRSSPVTYSVSLVRYADILDAVSLSPLTVTSSKEVIEELADRYVAALDLHDNIRYVLENREQFEGADFEKLATADKAVVTVLNGIRVRAAACASNPTDVSVCKFAPSGEMQLPEIELPKRFVRQFRLARTQVCGVERFEEKEMLNRCRHPDNGLEVVETRDFYWHLPCDEGRDDVSGDLPADNWRRDTLEQSCQTSAGRWAPRDTGLDSNWSMQRYFWPGNDGSTCIEGNQGTRVYRTRCAARYVRQQPKFGESRSCGTAQQPDYNSPIYKECRHESHGYVE